LRENSRDHHEVAKQRQQVK